MDLIKTIIKGGNIFKVEWGKLIREIFCYTPYMLYHKEFRPFSNNSIDVLLDVECEIGIYNESKKGN